MSIRRKSLTALVVAMALLAPATARADARQTQDFLAGNGTVGPYTLSWKPVLPGTPTVTVNSLPMSWGVDYTVDAAAGTITFTHPLAATSAAAITYGYDTAKSQNQGSGFKLPLTFALGENVALSGLYSRQTVGGSDPGALNLGLNGGWQNANGGKLTTHLLFVPAMTGQDSHVAANGLGRVGLAVGGQTMIGKPLQVSFGFSRAGLGVGKQGGDDWQAGKQKITLNGAYTPTRQVQATFGYLQTDAAVPGKGPTQTQYNAALALTPSDKAHIQTSLVQTEGGSGGPVQTLAASAALKPTGKTELDADWSQKNSSDKGGSDQKIDLKAALALSPKMSLTATAGQASTNGSGTTQTLGATAVVKPTSTSELDATFGQKDSPVAADSTQNLNLKAALAPSKTMSLAATLNQSSHGGEDTNAQAIHLSLNLQKTLQINTGMSVLQDHKASTQVTSVDGKMQPWAFLLLSGGYQWRTITQRQPLPTDPTGSLDTSTAQFTLAPKSPIHLVGTYSQNPTDDNGNLQHIAKHGLSLETTIGALKLTGGYDWSQQYAAPSTGTSLHVALGLRCSATTQLTGDYKQDLTYTSALGGTDAYSLGLTRNLGDAFDLSLTGTMQQPVGPANTAPSTVTASANLGMKF